MNTLPDKPKNLATVQRRQERAMLGVTLLNQIRNEDVRRGAGLPKVLDLAWRRKLKEARRLAELDGVRWSEATTE